MTEYEDTITINRELEKVFAFLADLGQLPKFFPGIRRIEREAEDRVRVEGDVFGRRFSQAGYFRVDRDTRKIEFGAEGQFAFDGWLQVTQGPDLSAADLTAHLNLKLPRQQEDMLCSPVTDFDIRVQDGLLRALKYLKTVCERPGGPIDTADRAAA